ncbi:Uncharacterised protein [uncultured archaeon]|nr:Uncharacterised protein [uncultured archaeon]
MATISLQSHVAVFLIELFKCFPGTYSIAVGYNYSASAAFSTDVLAVISLKCHFCGPSEIHKPESLPCADSIAIGNNRPTNATLGTDILAVGGLQSKISASQGNEFECLPCTYCVTVGHD